MATPSELAVIDGQPYTMNSRLREQRLCNCSFPFWYLLSLKWEKYDFHSVCFLGLDEATVKIRIEKNDAITKISAGEDNFCGSNWVKFPSVPS